MNAFVCKQFLKAYIYITCNSIVCIYLCAYFYITSHDDKMIIFLFPLKITNPLACNLLSLYR